MPHVGDPQLPFDDIQNPDTPNPIFHRLRAETRKGSSCIVPAPWKYSSVTRFAYPHREVHESWVVQVFIGNPWVGAHFPAWGPSQHRRPTMQL